jgi:hypothetical protein
MLDGGHSGSSGEQLFFQKRFQQDPTNFSCAQHRYPLL